MVLRILHALTTFTPTSLFVFLSPSFELQIKRFVSFSTMHPQKSDRDRYADCDEDSLTIPIINYFFRDQKTSLTLF